MDANWGLGVNIHTILTMKRIPVSGSGCTMGFVWHGSIIFCYTLKIQQRPGLVLRSRDWLLWIARRTAPAPNLHSGASVGRRDQKAQLQALGLTVMMKQIWNGLQVRRWLGGGSDIFRLTRNSNAISNAIYSMKIG